MKNRTQTRALAVIAVTMATVLSACGSTGSSTSSASSTESQSATATNAASNDPNLLFAQCMRDKGFDVPDTGLTPDQLNDHSTAFDSALNECMMKVSGLTGEDNIANDPAARESMVKAAQCLREAGYDVKDPQAGEGISVKDIPEDVLNKCFQQSGAAK
ncbi:MULTISPECIES: hypothetical protein [Actinomycetaceae]|uniref:hypothetical protein n=1 Tax=Actinomycetaceae TaxID=2049 RepID=UPI0022E379CF|nr:MULTISPECIES: hypothetical protein [unclassified Pauljensenia]MDK6400268.1 hypothetical protein [Pauljensenia sp. UMB9872]MDK7173563.1 hypothetical protein [Pauljensenia sp. UMB1235]